jgi:hypothetical protein
VIVAEGGSALSGSTGGIYVNSPAVPFEQADKYPATKQYVDLLTQYANGAKPKAFGVNSFSAWVLWAEAAKACGSTLTRDCVLSHALATPTGPPAGSTLRPSPATLRLGARNASCC